jgi:hypothetical protein
MSNATEIIAVLSSIVAVIVAAIMSYLASRDLRKRRSDEKAYQLVRDIVIKSSSSKNGDDGPSWEGNGSPSEGYIHDVDSIDRVLEELPEGGLLGDDKKENYTGV